MSVENVVYAPRKPIVSAERSHGGRPPALGHEREHEAERERPGDVDDERPPRERAALAAADEALEPVARERAERSGDCDGKGRPHLGSSRS